MTTRSNISSSHDVPTDAVYRCYVQSTVPKGAGRGDLWLDTSGTPAFKIHDGAEFVSAGGGGLANVVEDLTPQLGGDLDVNDQKIVAGASTNIVLQLGSTGSSTFFVLKDSNAVTQFTINGDGTLNVTANIIISGLIDGRDVAADGDVLDLIEPSATADQSDAEIKTAYNAQVAAVSQATAEAGTDTAITRWTAERVKQAIAALETGNIGVSAFNSFDVSISDQTTLPLNFDSEDYDTDNIHNVVTNTSRFTARTAGIYAIWAGGLWTFNTTNQRQLILELNGSLNIAKSSYSGEFHQNSVSTIYKMNVGDYIKLKVFQNSGTTLDFRLTHDFGYNFRMQLIART